MALNPSDLSALQNLFQLAADTNWPMHRGGKFSIETEDGREAIIPVAVYRPPPRRTYTPDDEDGLTEMERDVLQAVAEGGGEPMTAEEIAAKSGYDCNTRFKESLARLVRVGRLSRAPGRAGYLPPVD
jgi:hypothetical protein